MTTSIADCEDLDCIAERERLANLLNEKMVKKDGGNNRRLAIMLGMLTKDREHPIQANIPSKNRSAFSQERYKFFLDAPFEISNKCCNVMKKGPAHDYNKKTGRNPITAQMASESRLRTQKWLESGCNGFDLKIPTSNPMAFWTEQDVLLYIRQNNLPIAKPYGKVLTEDEASGQMTIADYMEMSGELDMMGLFEKDLPTYCTTGCSRTGCAFCGFGAHMDTERYASIDVFSNKAIRDYCMRGGAFDENGTWRPSGDGLGMWFVIRWINLAGKFNTVIPEYKRYEAAYGNDRTREELERAEIIGNLYEAERKSKKGR